MLSISFVITSISYGAFVIWYLNKQQQTVVALSKTVSNLISQDLAKLLLLDDLTIAADISSQLQSFPAILSVALYTKDGKVLYEYVKNSDEASYIDTFDKSLKMQKKDGVLELYNKINYQGRFLGYMQFRVHIETVAQILKKDMIFLLLSYFAVFLFSVILSVIYAKEFTYPILRLVRFLERIDFENLSYKPIDIFANNEFDILYKNVNYMLYSIERSLNEKRVASVAFEIQTPLLITDQSMKIIKTNQAYTEVTGYTEAESLEKIPKCVEKIIEDKELYKEVMNSLKQQHYWQGEIINSRKNKKKIIEHITLQEVINDAGELTNYVISFLDVTEHKKAQKQIEYLLQYDPLTGLANKTLLLEYLQTKIDYSIVHRWHLLLAFNIKDFKIFNEVYGYKIGDLLLKNIAKRLKKSFPDSDFISKIGIDEFILYYNFEKDQDILEKSRELVAHLNQVLSSTFVIEGIEIDLSSYIGITFSNQHEFNASTLLKQVSTAIQSAKERSIAIAYFNQEMEDKLKADIDIYGELLQAIKKEEFELYYQLQFNKEQEIYGAEALIRWNHPSRGLLLPSSFISICEKSELIIDIGLWVLREVCQQLVEWQKNPRTKDWIIAVNVSAKQLEEENFLQQVATILTETAVDPSRLKIELLESVIIKDVEATVKKMEALQNMGLQLSIDDFGTGYSSLQYLKDLPINQIKIDQSFVINMFQNRKNQAIIRAVIGLGSDLGFNVIAEGVEHEEHYKVLKKMGCQYFQGYYFARPEPINSIVKRFLK